MYSSPIWQNKKESRESKINFNPTFDQVRVHPDNEWWEVADIM
jgi:hypothetical protein